MTVIITAFLAAAILPMVIVSSATLEVLAGDGGDNATLTSNDSNIIIEGAGKKTGLKHSRQFYVEAHQFMIKSRPFRNFTLEDSTNWITNIEESPYPSDFPERFPYYMSGYDYEDRPVWVAEIGKYNIRRVVEEGQKAKEGFIVYFSQLCIHILESMEEQRLRGKDVRDIFFVADWEGMDYTQVGHLPTLQWFLGLVNQYLEILINALYKAIGINVSYPVEVAFSIARPLTGGLLEKAILFGTNKPKWVAALQHHIPVESIPTWYGGSPDFKPLKLYG